MMVARFLGCPFSVTMPAPSDGPASAFLSVGWVGTTRPIYETTFAYDAPARTVSIPRSPCGDVWVRVLFDLDGDRKLSRGDRLCQGADEHAVVFHHVAAGGSELVCQPGPPR
jgi:hypothetical protein